MAVTKKVISEYYDFFMSCSDAIIRGQAINKAKFDKIYKHLLKLKRINPTNPEVYDKLGIAACILKDKNKSVDYHSAAIRLKSSTPDYHHNLATSLLRFGDAKTAIKHSKNAIDLNPNVPVYRIIYIECLEHMEKIDEAKKYTEKLLKGKFSGNDTLIEKYEDLLDNDEIDDLIKRANAPNHRFVPIEKAMG